MAVLLSVRVQPRASREKIEVDGEQIKVWVTASPTDGQANDAVCRLLAKKVGVAPSRVDVVRGQTSRTKQISVEGIDEATLWNALRG